jgi:hypothetical protein
MAFAVIFPFLKMRNLFEIFEDAYTNPSQCPAPRRILAYGVGYNLFTEFSALPWCNGLDQNALRGSVIVDVLYISNVLRYIQIRHQVWVYITGATYLPC